MGYLEAPLIEILPFLPQIEIPLAGDIFGPPAVMSGADGEAARTAPQKFGRAPESP
jgi:hypothetical protein